MFGPLFRKELLEMARRPRYFVLRAAVAVGAGLMLLALFDGALRMDTGRTAKLAAIGAALFSNWTLWVGFGIAFVTPMATAGVIAAERDGRTLETLLSTRLSGREILLGKVASRVFLCGMLVMATAPVLALGSLLGGFTVEQVAKAGAAFIAMIALVSGFGLYYSVTTAKPHVAVIRTYAALLVVWWLLPKVGVIAFSWLLGLFPAQGMSFAVSLATQGLDAFSLLAPVDRSGGFVIGPAMGPLWLFRTHRLQLLWTRGSGGGLPPSPWWDALAELSGVIIVVAHLVVATLLFLLAERRLRRPFGKLRDPLIVRILHGAYLG
ncbi:MAG TPA: hypothetical protein VNC50_22450, partial [Planctomycetia bacterium]|nr:hypothetical protein [Planctomycetia bacterium]